MRFHLISFHLFSFLRCVEKTTDGLEMDVPSHYCDPENRPVLKRDCVLHCPGECVISEWTEWSTCHSVRLFFFFKSTCKIWKEKTPLNSTRKKNLNFKFENSKILWNLVSFFQNEHVKNCDKIIYVKFFGKSAIVVCFFKSCNILLEGLCGKRFATS